MQGLSPEVGAASGGRLSCAGSRRAGVAFVAASAAAFGAMAIFARVAMRDGADTVGLLALRFVLAGAILVALAAVARVRVPRGRDLATLVALGAVGYAAQSASFFTALTLAPAGLVALLLYLHPAIVALLAAWRGHDRLSPRTLAALVVALVGTALTVVPTIAAGGGGAHPAGIALGLLAALIYAVYIVASAGVASRVDPLAMSTVVIASAGATFAAFALARGASLPAGPAGWLASVAIALLSTVAAITWYFAGLKRVGPTRAATLSTIEPVVTVALAAVVLGERIAPAQLAGGVLILAAVVMLSKGSEERVS